MTPEQLDTLRPKLQRWDCRFGLAADREDVAVEAKALHETRQSILNSDPKRTLTGLYNERTKWLANLHAALDAAVLTAYGWPADLSDEELLGRLLALNHERAAAMEA